MRRRAVTSQDGVYVISNEENSRLFVSMPRFICCFRIQAACTFTSLSASSHCAYRQPNVNFEAQAPDDANNGDLVSSEERCSAGLIQLPL